MTVVPFVDLPAQQRPLRPAIDAAVARVLDSGRFVLGPELAVFEAEFAAYCGVRHCVGVGSGSDALALALRASDIGPGDEVIVPGFGFVATAFAVVAVGATPVLVDVDEETALLDVERAARAVTARTRAIVPVHLYGRSVELAALEELCRRHGLALIEDAAQAHGATWHGRRVGGVGSAGCFSFYPSKNLGAAGDAGAVVTDADELARRLRLLRDHGQRPKYRHVAFGLNSRLDELQAAILRVELPRLDEWNEARRRAAVLYSELLDARVRLPEVVPGHVFHAYVVRTRRRNALRKHLARHGVQTQVHYPIPIHRQPPFRGQALELPAAERLAREVLSLPIFPTITEEQIRYVADCVGAWLDGDPE